MPVAIRGTGDIWPRGFRLFRPGSVDVRVLPAIAVDTTPGATHRLNDAAAAAIAGALST